MARKRINRGVVALSASAVAAVYLAGYLRTASPSGDVAIDLGGVGAPVAIVSAAPLERVTAAPELAFTAPVSGYRDGHYTGQGSTPRIDVISRATYSSQAFKTAVMQALTQAA